MAVKRFHVGRRLIKLSITKRFFCNLIDYVIILFAPVLTFHLRNSNEEVIHDKNLERNIGFASLKSFISLSRIITK